MKSMYDSSLTPNCLYAGWYLICVHDLTIWVPWWVSYTKQELLTLPEHLGSPPVFAVVRGANQIFWFSVLCLFLLFVFVSCAPNVARVSVLSILNCLFAFLSLLFRSMTMFCLPDLKVRIHTESSDNLYRKRLVLLWIVRWFAQYDLICLFCCFF